MMTEASYENKEMEAKRAMFSKSATPSFTERMAEQLTEEQKEEFKEAFKLFDKDGDGAITAKELGNVMRGLGQNPTEQEIRDMINEVDTDGNGSIEFPEFLLLIGNRLRTDSIEDEFRDAFAVFDKDCDGFLTSTELREVLNYEGDSMPKHDIDDMIKEADKNSDGKIDYSEFVSQLMMAL